MTHHRANRDIRCASQRMEVPSSLHMKCPGGAETPRGADDTRMRGDDMDEANRRTAGCKSSTSPELLGMANHCEFAPVRLTGPTFVDPNALKVSDSPTYRTPEVDEVSGNTGSTQPGTGALDVR